MFVLAIVLFSPSLDFGREWPDRSEEGERERRVAFSEIELAAVTGGRARVNARSIRGSIDLPR